MTSHEASPACRAHSTPTGRGVCAAALLGVAFLFAPRWAMGEDLEILARRSLPVPMKHAHDVRWDGPDAVVLANGAHGIHWLPLDPRLPGRQILPGGKTQDAVWLAFRLALDGSTLAIAAPLYELVWQRRDGGDLHRDVVLEFMNDMDLRGDQLLLLGTYRDESGRRSPDAALAWLVEFDGNEVGRRHAITFSSLGPGPQAMDACGAFELGHVRFLSDGRALVVPGAEPGAFLYDTTGKLLATWDTTALGLDVPCATLEQERVEALSRDPDARWAWLNGFETVDEILDLPAAPVLITRRVTDGKTRWRTIELLPQAKTTRRDLPLPSLSKNTHLRADFDGERIVFLLYEAESRQPTEPVTPELIVTGGDLFGPRGTEAHSEAKR